MKKSRSTEEQMVAMLRAADRTSVADVSRKYEVSDQTL
jgi:putative transposase